MQYIITVSVTQTHTCLGGLNGLPVVTRAFGSRERGESGVLPGRDLSTFVAGRTLTNLQHRAKSSISLFPVIKGNINLRFQMKVYLKRPHITDYQLHFQNCCTLHHLMQYGY